MIEIGQIEHILINPDYVTIRFTNFFNGGKFTQKALRAFINNCDQDILKISVHESMIHKFKKVIKGLQYGVKSIDIDKDHFINMDLKNIGALYTNFDNRFELLDKFINDINNGA